MSVTISEVSHECRGKTHMPATSMNHFTILTDDLEATLNFYNEFLGLVAGPRPPFKFPGAWLYSGDTAILHVIAGRPLPERPEGVIDHMAFSAVGLVETTNKLKAKGVDYSLRRVTDEDPWQLFFHDPSGAKVELDFDSSETAPTETK